MGFIEGFSSEVGRALKAKLLISSLKSSKKNDLKSCTQNQGVVKKCQSLMTSSRD